MKIIECIRQLFSAADQKETAASATAATPPSAAPSMVVPAGQVASQSRREVEAVSPLVTYRNAFDAAQQRARKLGVEVAPVQFSEHSYLADLDRLSGAGHVLAKYLRDNGLDVKDLAAQCWRANMEVKSLLEQHFGTPLTLTFGAIETSLGTIRFQMSEKELHSLVKNGLDLRAPVVNLHAWLTFPSMEILDITYLTSYGVVNDLPHLLGLVVSGQHGDLNPKNYIYHPLVVGEDFVRKAGLNRVGITFG